MPNRSFIVALLAAIASAGCARAADTPLPSRGCAAAQIDRGRYLDRPVHVDGTRRSFILDVPDPVKPHVPVPLLLDFHGFGHSGDGVWRVSEFKALAAQIGFITAYPEGLPVRLKIRGAEREAPGWKMDRVAGNRDLAFVRAMLDDIEGRYCIDRRRIYATGFSNGAFFSQLLACALADRIAAVAPVSGGALQVRCEPTRPVPILIQHGRQDPLIPVEAARAAFEKWVALDGCDRGAKLRDGAACTRYDRCRGGAAVVYCEEDYEHRWPPQATERVWEFLRRHPMP